MRNLVRYLVRGDGEVDDIAQQALIAILQGLPSFRGDAPVERWADRITARVTFRHLRLGRRRGALVVLSDPEPEAAVDERSEWDRRRDLVRLLDALPQEQRDALVLHHLVGLTTPELADWMEVSVDTAKSRLRLGMEKVRARLRQATREAAS